jgi:hypothetical protein
MATVAGTQRAAVGTAFRHVPADIKVRHTYMSHSFPCRGGEEVRHVRMQYESVRLYDTVSGPGACPQILRIHVGQ